MNIRRKKGFYSISAVAKMFSVHQQTVRLYEKQGLITPKRSAGNTRLFSEEDIDKLEEVIHLTHTLGINLAGVEMILKLKKQITKMQKNMNQLFDETQEDLEKQVQQTKETIASGAQRLLDIKGTAQKDSPDHQETDNTIDIESWDIQYEDD